MENCYRCQSENIIRNGVNSLNGKQKYLCKDCKSILTERANKNIVEKSIKQKMIKYNKEGMSVKDVASMFGLSIQRVYEVVHNYTRRA